MREGGGGGGRGAGMDWAAVDEREFPADAAYVHHDKVAEATGSCIGVAHERAAAAVSSRSRSNLAGREKLQRQPPAACSTDDTDAEWRRERRGFLREDEAG